MISTVLFAAISIVQSLLSNGIDQNTLHPQKDTLTAIASGHRFVHSLGYVTNGLIHFYDAVYYDRTEYNNWYAVETNTEVSSTYTYDYLYQWHDIIGGKDLICIHSGTEDPWRYYYYSSISDSSGIKYKSRDWASILIPPRYGRSSVFTTSGNDNISGKCSEYAYQVWGFTQANTASEVDFFALIAETKRYYRNFNNTGVHRGLMCSTCNPVLNTRDGYTATGFEFRTPIIATSLSPFRQPITTDGNIANTNNYLLASVCPFSFSDPSDSVITPIYTSNTNGVIKYSNVKTIYLSDGYLHSATTNFTSSGNIGLINQYISRNYSIYAFDGGWNNTYSAYSRFIGSDFFNNNIVSDYNNRILLIPESSITGNLPSSSYSHSAPSEGDIVFKPGLHIGGVPLIRLGSGSTVDEMYDNATIVDSPSLLIINSSYGYEAHDIFPQINCIRIYDRELTEAEKEQNRSVDEARFGFKIWNYRVNEQ